MSVFYENHHMPLRSFLFHDLNFSAHLHKEIELLFILEGEMTATADGIPYTLHSGSLFVLFPNTVHSYLSLQKCSGILTIFSPELTEEFRYKLTHFSSPSPLLTSDQIHPDISYCLKSLLEVEAAPENLNLIRGYLLILLGRIFSTLQLKPLDRRKDFDLLHRVLLYITEHFTEGLSLDQIAKEVGVSKYYLSRIFSEKMGCGLNYYINSLRLGLAQHLLEDPRLTISEIAFESGFDSVRTFNRVFRAQLHKTPREYREQLRGIDTTQ